MGFRINTNIAALNAHLYGVGTNREINSSLEKLSSGLRINKAADDSSDYGSDCWYDNADIADHVVERMVDAAMYSRANICIIPIQDCLSLDSESRMNTPGTTTGNWSWQFQWEQIEQQHDIDRMKKMRLRNEKAKRLVEPSN